MFLKDFIYIYKLYSIIMLSKTLTEYFNEFNRIWICWILQ
jgi:hypothetical protein